MDLYEEIEKDTQRTRSEMHIFVSDIQNGRKIKNVFRKSKHNERHYEIMSRILFIYGKLNPGIKYVQGYVCMKA